MRRLPRHSLSSIAVRGWCLYPGDGLSGSDEANRFHEKGEWSLDGAGKTLTLTDDEGARLWRVRDAATLEALDLEGNEIESSLNYTLKRTDGFVTETLENSYWRLTELRGEPVETTQGQREAHLVLHPEEQRVAGATGCNQLSGRYQLEDDQLSFGPLATTRMACMNEANVESRFLAAWRKPRLIECWPTGWNSTTTKANCWRSSWCNTSRKRYRRPDQAGPEAGLFCAGVLRGAQGNSPL